MNYVTIGVRKRIEMNDYIIYTRGICNPTTNEGRWAAVITNGDKIVKAIKGITPKTNKNRMELVAIANSLSLFKSSKEKENIIILSDSQFITNAINRGWYGNWAAKGWKSYKGKVVWNSDVWEYIVKSLKMHTVDIRWLQDFSQTDFGQRTEQLLLN